MRSGDSGRICLPPAAPAPRQAQLGGAAGARKAVGPGLGRGGLSGGWAPALGDGVSGVLAALAPVRSRSPGARPAAEPSCHQQGAPRSPRAGGWESRAAAAPLRSRGPGCRSPGRPQRGSGTCAGRNPEPGAPAPRRQAQRPRRLPGPRLPGSAGAEGAGPGSASGGGGRGLGRLPERRGRAWRRRRRRERRGRAM